MRHTVIAFFLSALLGGCSQHAVLPATPTTELAPDLVDYTIALVAEGRDGAPRAYCSGVWVGPTSILTAAHCVSEDTETVDYSTRGDVEITATDSTSVFSVVRRPAGVVALDTKHDLAMLAAKNPPPHRFARVSEDELVVGQEVESMGHPLGLWWSFSAGHISALRFYDTQNGEGIMEWVQATAPISPGNSGGGLFDVRGNLIGICHGTFTRGQSLNIWVHRDYVKAFVERRSAK